jgi:hypothetical protein
VALFLAFGRFTPLFHVVSQIPYVNKFRFPARYLLLFHFAAAVLTAIAFADWVELARDRVRIPWRRLWPVLLVPAAAVFFAVGLKVAPWAMPAALLQPDLVSFPAIRIGLLPIVTATLLVVMFSRGFRPALPALLVFAVLDIGYYGISYLRTRQTTNSGSIEMAKFHPPAEVGSRFKQRYGEWNMAWIGAGYRLVDGYVGLEPHRVLDYNLPSTLRVAGVAWSMNDVWGKAWTPIPDSLPRARLVTNAIPSLDPRRDLERIHHETSALVERELELNGASEPIGTAQIGRDRPGMIDLWVEASGPRLMVLAESYHQGWQASVDGKPATVVRVNGDFLGCRVGPGRHWVSLRFRPSSLRDGMWTTIAGLTLAMITALVNFWPSSRRARAGRNMPAMISHPSAHRGPRCSATKENRAAVLRRISYATARSIATRNARWWLIVPPLLARGARRGGRVSVCAAGLVAVED